MSVDDKTNQKGYKDTDKTANQKIFNKRIIIELLEPCYRLNA
jgi:hypothetical protein